MFNIRLYHWILVCFIVFCPTIKAASMPQKLIGALPHNSWGKFDVNGQSARILKAIAIELNTELSLYKCAWVRCLRSLETGVSDIMVSLYYSKAREGYLIFITPEIKKEQHGFVFYGHPDGGFEITGLASLQGKRVGVVRGNIYFDDFDSDSRIVKVPGRRIQNLVDLLSRKRIDVFIDSPITRNTNLKAYEPFQQLKKFDYIHRVDIAEFVAISRQSPWAEHTKALSLAVKKLVEEGTIKAIFQLGL